MLSLKTEQLDASRQTVAILDSIRGAAMKRARSESSIFNRMVSSLTFETQTLIPTNKRSAKDEGLSPVASEPQVPESDQFQSPECLPGKRHIGQDLNSKPINTSSLNNFHLVNEIDRNSLENLDPNEAPSPASVQQPPSCVVVNERWPFNFKYPVFRLDPSEAKNFSDPNYHLCPSEINLVVNVLFQEMVKIIKSERLDREQPTQGI